MGERKTRFDKAVKEEEKKAAENAFERSNRTLKSPQPNGTDRQNEKTEPITRDAGEETEPSKNTAGNTEMKAEERDTVSRRLNISDITDAAAKKGKKKGGRSRTFYMQDAMYEKLASAAEKNGIKPSQLLHIILENVLDKM